MPYGYPGCYLRIDVSTGRAERVPLGDALLRQYIGGSGLGTRLLIDEGGAVADPLSPEAPLVFAFSPLVGTPLTTSAKFAVVSRSPLTQRVNDSLAGSGFALAGKRCGSDALVIVGRASGLSLLVIDAGDGRLESAEDLRGDSCPLPKRRCEPGSGPISGSRRSDRPESAACATRPSRTIGGTRAAAD